MSSGKLDRNETYTAEFLVHTNVPPPKFFVHDLIPEGLTIIAGRPKSAKSWLGLNLCYSVALGVEALGCYDTERTNTLFIGLEDSFGRLRNRLTMMKNGNPDEPYPPNLHVRVMIEPMENGGEEHLKRLVEEHDIGLVVIDTLFKYFGNTVKSRSAYQDDIAITGRIQDFAINLGISTIGIHHTRKPKDPDHFLTEVSGTYGLTGEADSVIVVQRDAIGPVISATGRDIDEFEKRRASFDKTTGWWSMGMENVGIHMTAIRAEILKIFESGNRGYTISEFANIWGKGYDVTKKHLSRLYQAGLLARKGDGIYDIHRTIV